MSPPLPRRPRDLSPPTRPSRDRPALSLLALLVLASLALAGYPGAGPARVAAEAGEQAPTTTTTAPTTTTMPGGGLSPILVPEHGALFGASAAPRAGQTRSQALAALEAQVGRQLDVVHSFHRWTSPFPVGRERRWARQGRILLLNWKPLRAGRPVPWARIAAGAEDHVIAAAARRLAALAPTRVMVAFHHEPENEVGSVWGSAADYAAAFRHVREVVTAEGATNVVWVWNVIGWVAGWGEQRYRELYPGDAYVDWVAYDPYNWWGCKAGAKWRSFAEASAPFYELSGREHPDKPLMVAEHGTMEGPGGKAQWFADELAALKTTRQRIKAVVYWNSGPPNYPCAFWSDTSPEAAAAFAAMAQDPYLNPRGRPGG